MVELNDMIIEYIDSVFDVKGGIIVESYGRRVYFDEIHKHITNVFNLDEFVAIGYLVSCFSETELDYDLFVCNTRPTFFAAGGGGVYYNDNGNVVMGMDFAMDYEHDAVNHITLPQGVQFNYDDAIDAIAYALYPAP